MQVVVTPTFSLADSDKKEQVERLEEEMRKHPQVNVEVHHCVNGGIYTRTGLIKAGTCFTGAVHKKDHINIVSGDVLVLTDDGVIRYTGYHVLPTKKGSKRVAFALQDTVWTTTLRTDKTNIADIEDESVVNAESLQSRNISLENK